MTEHDEQVPDGPEVTAHSPAEKVFVTVHGDSWAEVRFAPGFYATATHEQMQSQLTQVLRLLQVERTRALYDIRSREAGEPVRPGVDTLHRRAREYRGRLAELVAEGRSEGGDVTVLGVGLTDLRAVVAPGALDRLDEQQFAAACADAGMAFLADHLRQIAELKFDVYIRPMLESAGVEAAR